MRCNKPTLLFLTLFLFSTIPLTYAEWHFPTNLCIPEGLKWHFQDCWVFSNGSSMIITKFFINNWMNYTVDANGTQQIHNGTKPATVYFDDVNQTEGSTWSYADGTVTLTPPGTAVAITWSGAGNGNGNGDGDGEDGAIPSSWTQFLDFLWAGDILGFIQAVYVKAFQSADLFWGVLILLFMIPVYIRTRSLLFMCILWILLGSLFLVAMPIVSGLAVLLLSLGLAGMFFKLFMRIRG